MIRSLCIFCGSSSGADMVYREMAEKVAGFLLSEQITLVYGGANVGLMRVLADTMLSGGGKVIGVMPQSLVDREVAHEGLSEMHIVKDMQERKARMAELSDGFIALPGAYGTLDELFEMLTWNQLKIISKPVGLLNIKRFFSPLIEMLDRTVEEKFLRPEHRRILLVDEEIEGLFKQMALYKPVEASKWIEGLKEGKI